MSFFYQKSVASSRGHRTKEREPRPRASSLNPCGRRKTVNSKEQDVETPSPRSPVTEAGHQSPDVGITDPLQTLPGQESAIDSLKSVSSGQYADCDLPDIPGGSNQPFTPAALQQYLEQDEKVDEQTDGIVDEHHVSHRSEITALDIAAKDSRHQIDEAVPIECHNTTVAIENASQYQHVQESGPTASSVDINKGRLIMETPTSGPAGGQRSVKSRTHDTLLSGTNVRRRPRSQIIGTSEADNSARVLPEPQPSMMRTSSHASAPLLSRAFTPPPPPLKPTQAPSHISNSYAAPIPLRSRPTIAHYNIQEAIPLQYHFQQPIQTTDHAYYHSMNLQPDSQQQQQEEAAAAAAFAWHHIEAQHSMIPNHYNNMAQELPEDSLIDMLGQLQSALPQIQSILRNSQQLSAVNKAYNYNPAGFYRPSEHETSHLSQQAREARHKETIRHSGEIAILHGQIGELHTKVKHLEMGMAKQQRAMEHLREEMMILCGKSNRTMKGTAESKDELNHQADRRSSADHEAAKRIVTYYD